MGGVNATTEQTIPSPTLSADLRWRGLITQSTDREALDAALDGAATAAPLTYYVGFDPTAASLHVGHLVQVLTLRRLQLAGHHPLALVGGATGLIGDPRMSGERVLLEAELAHGWAEQIRAQISPFLAFDGPHPARMVNNLDWTQPLGSIEFLRDVGKHFSLNRMLDKESVKARLAGPGISFTEFSYQVLQAFDYLHLNRTYGCTLQFGGNDQWGNITAGVELIRRSAGATVHAFTTPLVTKADGTKFGKSEGGAVWLDASLTSPYAFYQFWLGADDRDINGYLRLFSFAPAEQILAWEQDTRERPAARQAQRALAAELTTLVHGQAECDAVIAASLALFGGGELAALPESTLAAAVAELPSVDAGPLQAGDIVTLLVGTGLCSSRGEARRTLAEGGVYLNNTRITDEEFTPDSSHWLQGRYLVLRRGKRTLAAVRRG